MNRKPPLSSKALLHLLIFSAFTFVLVILFVRFLTTILETGLLSLFNIKFIFSPFSVLFAYTETGNWNVNKILAAFGGIPLLLFVFGLGSLYIKTSYWKVNLALTWMAFILVNSLPLNLLAGAFLFQGFGIACQWLLPQLPLRIGLAIPVLALMLWSRPFWIQRFMRCAYSREFQSEEKRRKRFITYAVILPWYAGTMALIPFAFSGHSWFWLLSIAGLGLLFIPLGKYRIAAESVVYTTGKQIFTIPYPLFFVLAVVLTLFAVSWYTVR